MIVNVFNNIHPSNISFELIISLVGYFAVVMDVQSLNAFSFIVSTVDGISIVVNPLDWNAYESIVVIVDLISNCFNFSHPLNVYDGIVLYDVFHVTVDNFVHDSKTFVPSDSILFESVIVVNPLDLNE